MLIKMCPGVRNLFAGNSMPVKLRLVCEQTVGSTYSNWQNLARLSWSPGKTCCILWWWYAQKPSLCKILHTHVRDVPSSWRFRFYFCSLHCCQNFTFSTPLLSTFCIHSRKETSFLYSSEYGFGYYAMRVANIPDQQPYHFQCRNWTRHACSRILQL